MSFISFKLVPLHPERQLPLDFVRSTEYSNAPRPTPMFARVRLEVLDELVHRVLHVHVLDLVPHIVVVGKRGLLLLELALRVSERVPAQITPRSAPRRTRGQGGAPIGRTVLDVEQVVTHGLVRELVQERRKEVHRTVRDEQHPAWSRWIR